MSKLSKLSKVAFSGAMGTGKDTAVNYFISKVGGTRISFAGPLYDIMNYAQKICGFPQEKDREFLQWVGTDWGRKREDGVWIRIALEKANNEPGNTFVSDLRFPNELDALKKHGWVCVKLTRNCVDADRAGSGTHAHPSETALNGVNDWDYIINNDGSIEEFHTKLDNLIKTLSPINGQTSSTSDFPNCS